MLKNKKEEPLKNKNNSMKKTKIEIENNNHKSYSKNNLFTNNVISSDKNLFLNKINSNENKADMICKSVVNKSIKKFEQKTNIVMNDNLNSKKQNKLKISLIEWDNTNNYKNKKIVKSQLLDKNILHLNKNVNYFNLEIMYKKYHSIIEIIKENFEIYNKLILEKDYNIKLKTFNLKYYINEKLVILNSMHLIVNNSLIYIPFSICIFLIKFSENFLVKFMKELIFLLYRRKLKGFKKSYLNFNDFYTINKTIINGTIDLKEDLLKENYQLLLIPSNNKQVRKSIFLNNHNNSVLKGINNKNKYKESEFKNNISISSNCTSNKTTETSVENKSNSNNISRSDSSSSSSSSFEEDNLNSNKHSLCRKKSEKINKMQINFKGNFNKSNKVYNAKILYPWASIYSDGIIDDKSKKIIGISNKDLKDLISEDINYCQHFFNRLDNKIKIKI